MKQFTDSVRLNFLERLTSPLFGAFIVAWCAWNYRFLVVLLSDIPSVEKFRYIDTVLYPKYYGVSVIYLFAAPFLSAMAFVFVYPTVSKVFYGYWHRKQCDLKKLRDDIEGATLLTVEESRAMRKSMVQAEIANRETIQHQAQKIEQLQGMLTGQQQSSSGLQLENDELKRELKEAKRKQTELIGEVGKRTEIEKILKEAEQRMQEMAQELDKTKIQERIRNGRLSELGAPLGSDPGHLVRGALEVLMSMGGEEEFNELVKSMEGTRAKVSAIKKAIYNATEEGYAEVVLRDDQERVRITPRGLALLRALPSGAPHFNWNNVKHP